MSSGNLVIFDVDGTLFQTQYVTVPAVQQAFTVFGLTPPSHEDICSFFGKPVEAYEGWLASLCPSEVADELVETTNALELRFIGECGLLYPGAREALSDLAAGGYVLAICSNGPEPYVREFLRAYDLGGYFAEVCARGTRYADKEEMVGRILHAVQPKAFALVGDRREDMTAAHTHGGFGIAAVYGFGTPEEWHDADACIRSLREAPACVRNLLESSPG